MSGDNKSALSSQEISVSHDVGKDKSTEVISPLPPLKLPRYIILCGCIISSDFFIQMSPESRSKISTVSLTVLRIGQNLVFTTPTLLYASNKPCGDYASVSPTKVEKFALARFMLCLDPDHKHCFKLSTIFLDTVEINVQAIQIASSEQIKAMKMRYKRLRTEDGDVIESRKVRKVARLGTTDPTSYSTGTVDDDPDDVSGIEGEIGVLAKAEDRMMQHQAELEKARFSRAGGGRILAVLSSSYKKYQERNPMQFRRLQPTAAIRPMRHTQLHSPIQCAQLLPTSAAQQRSSATRLRQIVDVGKVEETSSMLTSLPRTQEDKAAALKVPGRTRKSHKKAVNSIAVAASSDRSSLFPLHETPQEIPAFERCEVKTALSTDMMASGGDEIDESVMSEQKMCKSDSEEDGDDLFGDKDDEDVEIEDYGGAGEDASEKDDGYCYGDDF